MNEKIIRDLTETFTKLIKKEVDLDVEKFIADQQQKIDRKIIEYMGRMKVNISQMQNNQNIAIKFEVNITMPSQT
jgi:hypothetical protein